jgi:hypothetical protein
VQRVRQSIPPVHQSKPDWAITSTLAEALGVDFNFQMSASTIFREMASRVAPYEGLRYASLKDESNPVQAKHAAAGRRDVSQQLAQLRSQLSEQTGAAEKITGTPPVGHELFRLGTLTEKTAQFHLLAAGNPEPPDVLVSPLYQITIEPRPTRRETAVAGD